MRPGYQVNDSYIIGNHKGSFKSLHQKNFQIETQSGILGVSIQERTGLQVNMNRKCRQPPNGGFSLIPATARDLQLLVEDQLLTDAGGVRSA